MKGAPVVNKKQRLQAAGRTVEELPVFDGMPALAEEIRNSFLEQSYSQRRCKFIDAQLRKMSEEELVRFEFFVRSHFPRPAVKKLLQEEVDKGLEQMRHARVAWNGQAGYVPDPTFVTDEMAIICSGLGKLLVGELVSAATEISREQTDADGSSAARTKITPELMDAAILRLQQEGKLGLSAGGSGRGGFLLSRQGALGVGGKMPPQQVPDIGDETLGVDEGINGDVMEEENAGEEVEKDLG